MEISVLQSLIDRTSNEIAKFELAIKFEKDHRKYYTEQWEVDQSIYTVKWCKQRLPKLREIQKALKKEISHKIGIKKSWAKMCKHSWEVM